MAVAQQKQQKYVDKFKTPKYNQKNITTAIENKKFDSK